MSLFRSLKDRLRSWPFRGLDAQAECPLCLVLPTVLERTIFEKHGTSVPAWKEPVGVAAAPARQRLGTGNLTSS